MMPGWLITVITTAACLSVALAVHVYIYRRYHYVCPKCSASFKPKTFPRSLVALNGGDMRRVRCPECGLREFMAAVKDGG